MAAYTENYNEFCSCREQLYIATSHGHENQATTVSRQIQFARGLLRTPVSSHEMIRAPSSANCAEVSVFDGPGSTYIYIYIYALYTYIHTNACMYIYIYIRINLLLADNLAF